MPRPKSWISRITLIISQLEAVGAAPQYRRSDVEKLFNVSASQAKDLMSVAGAAPPSPGLEATISRESLLAYVKYCPEAADALQEIERRKKLARRLQRSEEERKLRSIELRVVQEDEWSRFARLPNVSVRPGLLQVVFTPGDPIDVMDTLYRFVKAAGNDWRAFGRMCGGSSGGQGTLPLDDRRTA